MEATNGNPSICLVGAGRWGSRHLDTLKKLGVLGGVVESSPSRFEELKALHPEIRVFSSLVGSLTEKFDGYVVATPAETHLEVGLAILLSGYPALIEKPLALSSTDAKRLVKAAFEADVELMVGHLLLFHPAFQKIKEIIDSHRIGKLQYLYSNRLNLGTVRTQENILWSFAPHDVAIFQFLVGQRPLEVFSRGGAFLQADVHDSSLTILTYPNNIVGHIFVNWLHPFKEHRLVVIGSKGMLSYDDSSSDKLLKLYEKGVDFVRGEPISRDGPTEVIPYGNKPPLEAELSEFINRISKGSGERLSQTASGASAIEVLEILEEASKGLAGAHSTRKEPAPNGVKNDGVYLHPTVVVDEGVTIGRGSKIWHFSHVQTNARIGENCSIGQNVNIAENVQIGSNVKIQNNVSVYEGVELEDYVFCGPSVVFTNVQIPRSKYPQQGTQHYRRTLVQVGASIGANATIVCGCKLGSHSLIGAGAVVTRDVPDYAIVVGNPARLCGWVCECGRKLPKEFVAATCSKCSRQYRRVQGPDSVSVIPE